MEAPSDYLKHVERWKSLRLGNGSTILMGIDRGALAESGLTSVGSDFMNHFLSFLLVAASLVKFPQSLEVVNI